MVKVKSGCRTCKTRKVKCDETWPACSRCISTGRSCDGYGVWGGGGNRYGERTSRPVDPKRIRCPSSPPPSKPATPTSPPLLLVGAEEHTCIEWFVHRTASKLPGAFASEFWTTLLLQASLSERAVLHSILTLSSVHRKLVLRADTESSDTPKSEVFTLQHCDQAITLLRSQILENDQSSRLVALVICAVFIHLEYLKGCYRTALVHLRHGLMLLDGKPMTKNTNGIYESDIVGSLFHELVGNVFRHVYIQAHFLSQDILDSWPVSDSTNLNQIAGSFRPVEQARHNLEYLVIRILKLSGQYSEDPNPNDEIVHQLSDSHSELQSELDDWLRHCQEMVARLDRQISPSFIELVAWRVLRIYHTSADIMLDACILAGTKSSESIYDRYTSSFASIISQSIALRGKTKEHDIVPYQTSKCGRSIADIGWLPALYYTAVKCRVHRLRLQAVRMLGYLSHKEGIWDSELTAAVASKVMEIEEGDYYQGYQLDEDWPILVPPPAESELPAVPVLPQDRRIRIVQIDLPEGVAGKMVLWYVKSGKPCDGTFLKSTYDLRSNRWVDG